MAKLIRFLSGRWTTRNSRSTADTPKGLVSGAGGGQGGTVTRDAGRRHQRSRSADHHGLLMCKVALLDGTDVILDVPRRSVGSALYEKVFDHLDLIETEYFGLQFTDEQKIDCWLDSTKSIRRQMQLEKNSHGDQMFVLRFRVKFYSSDPNNLKEEITRYQFFLQLKSDVQSGRLFCPKETAVELAALVLQAELGDFDEEEHTLGVVSEYKFVPNQTEELEIAILKKFKTHRGLTPARCELIYLNKAKCLELYGVDFNVVRGKDENQYQLGLMPAGILVCERSQKIGLFCWPKITKLQFRKKRLHLEVVESDDRGQEQEHTFIFRLDSEKACKVLWRCAVEHHTFFRLSSPIKPYGLKSDFFRLGSRLRFSGNTELQTVSKTVLHRDIKFQRRRSRRYSRREKFDSRHQKEEINRKDNDLQLSTKRWSNVSEAQLGSRRKSRDLTSAVDETTQQKNSQTNQLETQAAITRATDARSSMQRRRSRNYSSGRSPSRVVDSDNNNLAKVANLPNLVPVQVTVSTQESFDDDAQQRVTMNDGSSSLRKSHRSVASKERLLQPPAPVPVPAPAVSSLRPSAATPSSSSGPCTVFLNERLRQSIADPVTHRSRPPSNGAIGVETLNRRRQSIALVPERNHRHQTAIHNNRQPPPHHYPIDSMPIISYSSLHMPRGRSRGMAGGMGERDLTSRLPSQSHFPPRQTPHRLSMLPRQQEYHHFKESYSEDLGHANGVNVPRSYQGSSSRRNNWSVDNLYNGHPVNNQSSPHFVPPFPHKYVSYDDDRPTLAYRPTPLIHSTNLATQV